VLQYKKPSSADHDIEELLELVSGWLIDAELRGMTGGFVPLAENLKRNLQTQLEERRQPGMWKFLRRAPSQRTAAEFFRLQARIDLLCQRLGTSNPPWVKPVEHSAHHR
jgi:hypothetical protein